MSICFECEGTGHVEDQSLIRHRVLPPQYAQALHDIARGDDPEHDQVACFCCCFDCPGWTEDREPWDGWKDLIPSHDSRSGKPVPSR